MQMFIHYTHTRALLYANKYAAANSANLAGVQKNYLKSDGYISIVLIAALFK